MAEKFNLKWNDYQSNVSRSFALFRNESHLHDVTLVSDDFKQTSGHKFVLSACSDYFKKLFQETKQVQPIVCLQGISSSDLRNILDYVYEGEVKILESEIQRFLSVAQRLKLQGIGENEPTNKQTDETSYFIDVKTTTVSVKDECQEQESNIGKVESQITPNIDISSELNQKMEENIVTNPDGSLSCFLCGKTSGGAQRKGHMKQHMEIHMEGLTYSCPKCDKTFRSRNSLYVHTSKIHK